MKSLPKHEVTLARLSEAEQRVDALMTRIARSRAEGRPTELYEQLLCTLQNSLAAMQAHVRRTNKTLLCYRCYLKNGDRIQGVRMFDASDDADVLIRAGGFLRTHPEYPEIEIWCGKRLVALLARS